MTSGLACDQHGRECVVYQGQVRHGSPGFYGEPCGSETFQVSFGVTRAEVIADLGFVTQLAQVAARAWDRARGVS